MAGMRIPLKNIVDWLFADCFYEKRHFVPSRFRNLPERGRGKVRRVSPVKDSPDGFRFGCREFPQRFVETFQGEAELRGHGRLRLEAGFAV